jgi:hypothetical protein
VLIEPGLESEFDPEIHFPGDCLKRESGCDLYFAPTERPLPGNVLLFDPNELPHIWNLYNSLNSRPTPMFQKSMVAEVELYQNPVSIFVTQKIYAAVLQQSEQHGHPFDRAVEWNIRAACINFGLKRITLPPARGFAG